MLAVLVPWAPSHRQKFIDLLREAGITQVPPRVISAVIRHYDCRLELVETPQEAYDLYCDAKNLPGTTTKRQLLTQHGLFVGGPLHPEAANSHLVMAVDVRSGRPCVIKFLDKDAGLGAASGEAQATRIICGDMPPDVPLVAG